ncbi:hypothetical protein [Kineococcus indalonis]|uniref:hypothetical protein n=1 Tax=Kineococcus indalonis TaxID=2696566 RepID=UPI001411D73C|nr:hypothetical protein [Kineococcus indalonis]NAZ87384.1 hypothetical protein [Kineococcus indalonis]
MPTTAAATAAVPTAPAAPPAACGAGWLSELLARGRCPDPARPWQPAPTPAVRAAVARDVREGLLQRLVGDVVVGAGVRVDAAVRARALALLVPADAVVVGVAAAWVHAGAPLPAPAQVLVVRRTPARHPVRGGVRLVVSRARLDDEDVVHVAGLALSSPARTLLDVARAEPRRAGQLRRLLAGAGLRGDDVERAAQRARGLAHVRSARRALAARPDTSGRTAASGEGALP